MAELLVKTEPFEPNSKSLDKVVYLSYGSQTLALEFGEKINRLTATESDGIKM